VPVSYCGVPLAFPAPALVDWADRLLPFAPGVEQAPRAWPGPRQSAAALPGPPGPPAARPCRLFWPAGASRFAQAHLLATDAQLASVRAWVYGGGGYRPGDLVMDDGTRSITTSLYLLPPRPLAQAGSGGLWLLPLVDERFYWWQRTADVAVTAGTTTWAQLFAAVGAALGVSISVPAIPAAYLTPPAGLAGRYEALPPLLDAAAFAVGLRITRSLGGTVEALAPRDALARHVTNLALAPRRAGGELALTLGA
jgi:hypothetical protein